VNPNIREVRPVLVALMRSSMALLGAVLATITAILFLVLFAVQQFGLKGGLYLGLVTFLLLPGLFVVGLLMIPFGIWRHRVGERKRVAAGAAALRAPVIDFNVPRTRLVAMGVLVFSSLNVVIVGAAAYKGVAVLDSNQFCGAACHSVMNPEMTAYQIAPHARVDCTDCHIGSGADWFLKAKVSGTRQMLGLLLKRYHRPIPTPVHNLRPAADTCEHCHSRERWIGDRLRIHNHFAPDEKQTVKKTVVMVNVGGDRNGKWQGIHRHNDPARQIRYLSDPKREHIYDVEMVENGTTKLFKPTAAPAGEIGHEWRAMDCTDCHNRPAHTYRLANDELDAALDSNALDRSLPFIKREALTALQAKYPLQADASVGIRLAIREFYRKEYPDLAQDVPRIDGAAAVVAGVYERNVFPEMNVGWGTYPTFDGHAGCFRCHDNEHVTASGEKITQKCELCHTTLATDEADPEVLQVLYP
jgi:hypothetical protein